MLISQHRVVTSEALEADATAPAPLNLPFGQLFFGFNVPPYVPPSEKPTEEEVCCFRFFIFSCRSYLPQWQPRTFTGSGNTLSGRSTAQLQSSSSKGKEKENATSWGPSGQALGSSRPGAFSRVASSGPHAVGAGGASVPVLPQRNKARQVQERSPSPDYGMDDDDDIIEIDSD